MAIMWGFHFARQWREEGSAQQSHVRQHEEGGRERGKEKSPLVASQFYCFYDCNKMQEIKKSNKLFKCSGDINTGWAR